MTSQTPGQNPAVAAARASLDGGAFIAMMAFLMALQALAIDSMLPALGQIAHDLDVSDPNRRQLVVGVFLMAAGFGSLVPGSLADRFGRRPVLLVCLILYIVFSLACAFATSFDMLLVLRICQAMGSGGLAVLPGAIIRDRMSGDRMARMMSVISMIFLLVPILAPSIGQFLLLFAGWRFIFVFLAVMAGMVAIWVHIRLPETLSSDFREPTPVSAMLGNMGRALINRGSIGYVVGGSLTFGAMIGYVNSSQQLVGEHFGAGPLFPVLFGGSAVLMACASFFNSRIVERFGARRVSHTALFVFIAVSALQVALAFAPHETLWQFMPVMAINMGLIGFIGANFNSISLQPFARTAGAASSVQAFVRMVIGSLVGITIGQAYDGTARPLAIALLLTAISSLLLVLFSEKGKLFRRLLPPGTPRPIAEH